MLANDLEILKIRAAEFLKQQNDFDPSQNLKVVCDEGDQYFIMYGYDMQIGIAGFGDTAEGAFNDFVVNWKMYRADGEVPARYLKEEDGVQPD